MKNSNKDRHVSFLEPVNITLHDKRCDKNKALEMKSLHWGALTTIPCILIKREVEANFGTDSKKR